MVKDSGHKWGIVKVPIDPKDPSKGVKAVPYDPYYKNLNGTEQITMQIRPEHIGLFRIQMR